MNISELQPNANFDSISGEIVSVEDPREFTNFRGAGKVASAVLKDKSGQVKLTLWNEQIDQIQAGSKVTIENGWVKEYRGELQVSTGKFGKITVE
jgi:replication factor A1